MSVDVGVSYENKQSQWSVPRLAFAVCAEKRDFGSSSARSKEKKSKEEKKHI